MHDDFNGFAVDSAHGCASRATDQLDAAMPFGDWAELGRRILTEAARRAIAEGASTTRGHSGADAERCRESAMISEDFA